MSSTKDVLSTGRRLLSDGRVTWRPMLFGGIKIHMSGPHIHKVVISHHVSGDIVKMALWSLTVKHTVEQAFLQIIKAVKVEWKQAKEQQGGSDGQEED